MEVVTVIILFDDKYGVDLKESISLAGYIRSNGVRPEKNVRLRESNGNGSSFRISISRVESGLVR